MDLQTVKEAAKHVWTERLGMAPIWTSASTAQSQQDSSNGQTLPSPTSTPLPTVSPQPSSKPQPVTDVTDHYEDTTPQSVKLAVGLGDATRVMEALTPPRSPTSFATEPVLAAKVYCTGCEELHEWPPCTSVKKRVAAMDANEHPAGEGAVHVDASPMSLDALMQRGRHE
jgi:hypothetical protein